MAAAAARATARYTDALPGDRAAQAGWWLSSVGVGAMGCLSCPVCQEGLERAGARFVCARRHSFDVAREGYVNLLPSRKLPRLAGDSKEMVHARQRFLERGHYERLSDALNTLAAGELAECPESAGPPAGCVLDVGCGPGYYVGRLQERLRQRPEPRHGGARLGFYGIDIARDAARLAARQYPDIQFVVADTQRRIPLADRSVRVLLDVFAPRNADEFARVVAPGGLLLVAIPRPDHLVELRAGADLLAIEEQKQERVIERFARTFELARTTEVAYEIEPGEEDLVDLVLMTPNYRHLTSSALDAIRARGPARITVSVAILAFTRTTRRA
jgi:23S rRNA (guanine745-N1)-methyltransferase